MLYIVVGLGYGNNFRYEVFQCVVAVFYLFPFEAEMSAGFGSFYDEGIRQVVVICQPFGADDLCRSC
ncbi:hypothetical protein Barb7_00229 [Bacteroidales bacterium Barb7]|nr:hypothetical protein Barb7_00229 [Bacteroidales bacterium Barb7]